MSQNRPEELSVFKAEDRIEVLNSEITMKQFKQYSIEKEIKLRKEARDKEFKERRLNMNKVEYGESFRNHLTMHKEFYEELNKIKVGLDEFDKYRGLFFSEDLKEKFFGLVGLRKILSLTNNPPIQEAINAGLVVELINLLSSTLPEFQFEALWCLTNITSGSREQVNAVVLKGGIEKIIPLIDSKYEEIQEQAIWTIGNIAGDSIMMRDRIIKRKGLETIIKHLQMSDRQSLVKHSIWAISNFCRSKPAADYYHFKPVVNIIMKVVFKLDFQEFLTDACWILAYLTENHKKIIKKIMQPSFLFKLVTFLDYPSIHLKLATLRVIGNIASGNALQTQMILDEGVIDKLKALVCHEKKSVRKEVCWILSNIAAGTQMQLEMLIKADILPCLDYLIRNDEVDIKKEAVWGACNLTNTEDPKLMEYILSQGILELVCLCLSQTESRILALSLEALNNLLHFGRSNLTYNGVNMIVIKLEQMGMCEVLENLQFNPNEVVYEKIMRILDNFFDVINNN